MVMRKIGDWAWYDFDSLESTNDYALTQSAAVKKALYTAKEQTKGRGRRGRSWISPQGNLYMSQLLLTAKSPIDLVYISAISIAQTISFFNAVLNPQIKWPNDVLIEGKKVCGILIEKSISGSSIIGIGVNLTSSPKAKVIYPTASLKDFNLNVSREDFMAKYLAFFDANMSKTLPQLIDYFMTRAYKLNETVTINLSDKKISGCFIGIDEKGFLLLKQGTKTTSINTGEILFS